MRSTEPLPGSDQYRIGCRPLFDGAQHRYGGSSDYGVRIGAAPDGCQDGGRLCKWCFALTYAAFGPGVCWDGEPHDVTDSPEYSLAMEPDVPPVPVPPPPLPTIMIDESWNSLDVSGEHYTMYGGIRLSFVCGADVVKFDLNADESGGFRVSVSVSEFDDECTGGAVVSVDVTTGKFVLGRVNNRFPRVHRPAPPVPIDHPEKVWNHSEYLGLAPFGEASK